MIFYSTSRYSSEMITFVCAMHHCSTTANVMLGNPYEGTPKAPSDVGTHDACFQLGSIYGMANKFSR